NIDLASDAGRYLLQVFIQKINFSVEDGATYRGHAVLVRIRRHRCRCSDDGAFGWSVVVDQHKGETRRRIVMEPVSSGQQNPKRSLVWPFQTEEQLGQRGRDKTDCNSPGQQPVTEEFRRGTNRLIGKMDAGS